MSITNQQQAKLRLSAVIEAEMFVGQGETPPGSNRGSLPDRCNVWAGVSLGSPWCAVWACMMLNLAGVLNGPRTASSGGIVAWGRQNGALKKNAEFGDLGEVIDPTSPTGYRHTVFIVHGTPKHLVTIEGNEGDEVRWNSRRIEELTLVNPYKLG